MIHMVITTPFGGLGLDIDKFFSVTNTNTPAYPPYNVIKFTDDEYTLQFAVAGFKKEDISITTEKNTLKIDGQMAEPQFEGEAGYVHKGIAGRKFQRSFTLPEYFEVDWAGMEDGILSISLVRNIPEEKKPKQINIS
jgi:molecular chaperone IbpA